MRRFALSFAIAFTLISPVSATTISDAFVPLIPGLIFQTVRESPLQGACPAADAGPWECSASSTTFGPAAIPIGIDAAGMSYFLRGPDTLLSPEIRGYVLERVTASGVTEQIAWAIYLPCPDASNCQPPWQEFRYSPKIMLDQANGRILLAVWALSCAGINCEPGANAKAGIVAMYGLPQLFDVFLSFQPDQQPVAVVPRHPDGFPSAEAIEVWAGPLPMTGTWTEAQPLACNRVS